MDMLLWACATFVHTAFDKYQANAAIDGPWPTDKLMVSVRPTDRGHVKVSASQGMLSMNCLWPTRAEDGQRIVWAWRMGWGDTKPTAYVDRWERV